MSPEASVRTDVGHPTPFAEAMIERYCCGAQGQMSQNLAGGLWMSAGLQIGGAKLHRSFGAKSAPQDDKGLGAQLSI